MNLYMTVDKLKEKEIQFSEGLTDSEIRKIEEIYGIKFPDSLYRFYSYGLPVSDDEWGFPRWNDFSDENIEKIKERIEAPLRWLLHAVLDDFWLPGWGKHGETVAETTARFAEVSQNAPRLIPIFSHRYVPMLGGISDPPVISAVGRDIIYYGINLQDYLRHEFIDKEKYITNKKYMFISFWSDIINGQDWHFNKVKN